MRELYLKITWPLFFSGHGVVVLLLAGHNSSLFVALVDDVTLGKGTIIKHCKQLCCEITASEIQCNLEAQKSVL